MKYKACHSCEEMRAQGRLEIALNCSSCKGKGIVRDYSSYQCNRCGWSMKATEECEDNSPHGLVEARVGGGYHSFHLMDCTTYVFSICEWCLRQLFDEFKVPPTVNDR